MLIIEVVRKNDCRKLARILSTRIKEILPTVRGGGGYTFTRKLYLGIFL